MKRSIMIIQEKCLVDVEVDFAYSSTLELVSSLHVISDPSHHPNCIDWYDKVKEKLDAKLLEQIVDFGNRYVNWSFVMDIVDYFIDIPKLSDAPIDDFPKIIKDIREMPDNLFAYIFLGETLIGGPEFSQRILNSSDLFNDYETLELKKYIKKEDVDKFLLDPLSIKEELISIMIKYYYAFFREHWKGTCGFYKAALLKERQVFEETTVSNYVLSLHEGLSLEDDNLVMTKETIFQCEAKKIERIKILFSTYTYPHLMMNIYDNTVSIYVNLIVPNMSTVFDDLANSVRIFGDSTRLAIIKLLFNSPANTKTLAKLLNMTPASVSQHLKILREGGLLSSHRDKNSVIYEIKKTEVVNVMRNILNFLELEDELIPMVGLPPSMN